MLKTIVPVLLLGISFLMFSCGSKEPAKIDDAQTELPPSLKPADEIIKLVQLTEKEQNELSVEVAEINRDYIDYSVVAPGVVFQAPNHSSIISTPIDGQISQIYKYEGSRVRKGEALFVIQSLEFGNLVSEYLQAYAEERFQTNRLSRLKQLVEETITSTSELERGTAEYDRASASSRAAYSKLKAIGVSDSEIRSFTEAENIDPVLKIRTPIDGVIEKNFVELGQSVNALENLSRVLDTREVLIRAYLSPDDARMINTGDSVSILKREDQKAQLFAKITSINPGLDEGSRSVIANIILPTSDGWPKPGENVRLNIVTSSQKEVFAIPVEALTYDGNQAIVFIRKENNIFERRAIEVSELRDKYVFVSNGLADGEKVAVTNVFSLKALLRFDIISED
jgi:cobalt-zinc-cadmium efflux system membrane fusion protein